MSQSKGDQPTTTTPQDPDKSALIAQVVSHAVATLGSAELEKEPEKEKEDSRWVEFRKVASADGLTAEVFEKFLNDNGFTWYYAGGYAYYRWCQHYGLDLIDYGDYDVVIDNSDYANVVLAMYGPHRKEEQWKIGGKVISLVPGDGTTPKQLIDSAWLVSPVKMAQSYGSGATAEKTEKWDPRKKATTSDSGNFLASIGKGGFKLRSTAAAETKSPVVTGTASDDVVDEEEKLRKEEKERVRGTRKAGMPALLEKYRKEFS